MTSPVRVTEICKITPPPESATESSLPLTFFDTYWFRLHPVERIFFYQLTADSSSFFSSILPTLKQSLSRTLLHFLPFAGHLIWPSNSDKPFILYTPGNGVSLTVTESDEDFYIVSGDSIREISNSHRYLPELDVTETRAATMSFQITFFPDKGFCIGISSHHAIFDGKSIIMFLKSWAYICNNIGKGTENPTLPAELTPFVDRTVIEDTDGLDMVFLEGHSGMCANPRSLELYDWFRSTTDANFVRGTFKVSGENINKMRAEAVSFRRGTNEANVKHYSTFVLTYAFVAIAIAKALRLERKKDLKLVVTYNADARARLDPPLHENYFGNCVIPLLVQTQVESLVKEDGLAVLAEELTQSVKGLEKGPLDGMKGMLEEFKKMDPTLTKMIGVAGSPRFGVYGVDFGWGKPKKVELTSIDRGSSISIADRRDGNGGVEVGVVLEKDEMKMFESLFVNGLKDLYMS